MLFCIYNGLMQFACRAKLKGKLLVPALNHYDTFASFKICSCLHGYIATRPPIGYNVVIIFDPICTILSNDKFHQFFAVRSFPGLIIILKIYADRSSGDEQKLSRSRMTQNVLLQGQVPDFYNLHY